MCPLFALARSLAYLIPKVTEAVCLMSHIFVGNGLFLQLSPIEVKHGETSPPKPQDYFPVLGDWSTTQSDKIQGLMNYESIKKRLR